MIHMGFDIGGTNIKAGLVDEDSKILIKRIVPFPKGPYGKTVDTIEKLAREMLSARDIRLEDVGSLGLAVPGSVDVMRGTVIDAYNLNFHDVPLKAAMGRRFPRIPVYLNNDASAAALAELSAGVFRGYQTAVLLTLGTGLGGGLILNGHLFNGGLGHGVEPGHMCIQEEGPSCTCGNKGCAESFCTAGWLAARGREGFRAGSGLIRKKAGGDLRRVNAKTVIDCAREGDPYSAAIFSEYTEHLSSLIASIANFLDPEIVALGGGVSLAGEFLLKPLRQKVREKSFFRHQYRIEAAQMGNDAGIVGAAMLCGDAKDRDPRRE